VRFETAVDLDELSRTAGFDAQRNRRQVLYNAFHQRWPLTPERLDAASHGQCPDRLADLYTHGAVRVRDDPIKLCPLDGPAVDVKSAGALAKGFDRRLHSKVADRAEVDESDAAWPVCSHLFFGGPSVNNSPVIKRHVVRAVRHNRTVVNDGIDEGAINCEYAARDLIRRACGDLSVHIDGFGFEALHVNTPTSVAGAANEYAASKDRSAETPDRDIGEVGGQNGVSIRLHVPKREGALKDRDAVLMRPLLLTTRIRRDDVQSVHLDMAPADFPFRQDLNPADRLDRVKAHPSQIFQRPIVPDGPSFCRRNKLDSADRVIGRELNTVRVLAELQGHPFFEAGTKALSRQQRDRWDFIQVRSDDDVPDFLVVRGTDKFFSRPCEPRLSVHFRQPQSSIVASPTTDKRAGRESLTDEPVLREASPLYTRPEYRRKSRRRLAGQRGKRFAEFGTIHACRARRQQDPNCSKYGTMISDTPLWRTKRFPLRMGLGMTGRAVSGSYVASNRRSDIADQSLLRGHGCFT